MWRHGIFKILGRILGRISRVGDNMHPLVNDLDSLKTTELEAKINDLTKKYFMTANPGMQAQISIVLDTYKEEIGKRQQLEWEKVLESRNKGLDKLINVS